MAARSLYRVRLVTECGHRVDDVLVAYDADDARRRARSMMRANHGVSYVTITNVEKV